VFHPEHHGNTQERGRDLELHSAKLASLSPDVFPRGRLIGRLLAVPAVLFASDLAAARG